ncbi:DNA polymerase III subunit alpha [Candidatus Woesebacteria bacterium]|nr:DNA polymerase III subunit alpha [Candidatus Woesebacteria bacterium]
MSFVHLHVHSAYSLLDGMCRIEDLIETAKKYKMPAVALTDHGALYGAFKFYIKAKDAGIKPIIGCELYKATRTRNDRSTAIDKKRFHLLVLAKNLTGYQNLLKLVSEANLTGFYYKPRVDWELLEKYREGLIVTSGCMQGEIPQHLLRDEEEKAEEILKKYLELFEGNFYIELQRHPQIDESEGLVKKLVALARKYALPLIATNDVHYINKDDAYAQEILLCIQTQRAIFEKDRPMSMIDVPDYYFKSPKEMAGDFHDYPEAIENTLKIAEQCDLEIPHGSLILPKYDIPKNTTPEDFLRKMTYECKGRVTEHDEKTVNDRLDYELDIINQKGYANYFLFVQDMVNWSKKQGIAVGPGRGSAAGSLVSYVLNITDINPLDFNLPFERFLNPARPTPPDIDIDFSDRRRDEVIDYISKKYGQENVAQVITFGTMESRMAIRDVARALGYTYSQGDRIAKMIPPPKQGFHRSLSQTLDEEAPFKYAYDHEEETKKVVDIAVKLEGLPRHFSVHAAAVVISDKPITEYVPIQKDNKEGRIITQYDMYSIDLNAVSENKAVGLVKVDILGLRNLSILEEAINFVKQTKGTKIDLHNIPLNDKKTYDLICSGKTIGVFQLESAGMRRLAKDLQPSKITDVNAMVALYRPGPMDLIPEFIKGKKNSKTIKYIHPDLKPVLEETYGVLVYQEQIIDIAVALADFDKSEADLLRMAVGKKKKKLMKEGKEKFTNGMLKNGYTKKLAKDIFGFIEKFAAYGFNKPHSASYGLIAYWTAYMKANYPVEFMTALLTAELHGTSGPLREVKMSRAIDDAKRMNIDILPPDINTSDEDFTIEDNAIRFGLSSVKNVGSAAISSILKTRKADGAFNSFSDFLMRVELRKVNKKCVENLIKSGTLGAFGNQATLLTHYPHVVRQISSLKEQQDKGQFGLFQAQDFNKERVDTFSHLPEFDNTTLVEHEKEVFGFLINSDPLKKHKKIIDKKVTKEFTDISEKDNNRSFIFAGRIVSKKIVSTKKNNHHMSFLTVNDGGDSIEIIVFPKVHAKFDSILLINNVILFKGKVSYKDSERKILLDNVVNLDLRKHT